MTVVRFFEVKDTDGPDAPGHYALLDDLVYLGPWYTAEQATAELQRLVQEAGSFEALVNEALLHTRRTRYRSAAATTFLHVRNGRRADGLYETRNNQRQGGRRIR